MILTNNSETESLGNETYQLASHVRPICYLDGTIWRRNDLNWIDGDQSNPHMITRAPFLISVSDSGMRRLHPTRQWDQFIEVGAPYVKVGGEWREVGFSGAQRAGNKVTWSRSQADLSVHMAGQGIKMEIALKNGYVPPDGQFAFPVGLHGLTRSGTKIYDGRQQVMRLRQPLVWDASNPYEPQHIAQEIVRIQDQAYILFTLPDISAYPNPIIDPTFAMTSPSVGTGGDVYIEDALQRDGENWYNVGVQTNSAPERGLLKLDLTNLPASADIQDVSFRMFLGTIWQTDGLSGTIEMYRQKRAWVEDEAIWADYSTGNSWQTAGGFGADDCEQIPIGTKVVEFGTPNSTWLTFPIYNITRKSQLDLGNGWLLKHTNETSSPTTQNRELIVSDDWSGQSLHTRIYITYSFREVKSWSGIDGDVYTTKESSDLWIQPDGPGHRSYYVGCQDLDTVQEDLGRIASVTSWPDPRSAGKWHVEGIVDSPPTPFDVSIGSFMGATARQIEQVACPFSLYILFKCGGKPSFGNYERVVTLPIIRKVGSGITNPVRKNRDVAILRTIRATVLPPAIEYIPPRSIRQTTAEANALLDIAFVHGSQCSGPALTAEGLCSFGMAVAEAGSGAIANVLDTEDGGETWTSQVGPFDIDIDIATVASVKNPNLIGTVRKIVINGSAITNGQGELAYTEDGGVTWTLVTFGGANSELYCPNDNSMFALDFDHIFWGTDQGFLYRSLDGGDTIELSESRLTLNPTNAIHFANELNGVFGADEGICGITANMGETWTLMTTIGDGTDNITSMWMFDKMRIIAGLDNGRIYQSFDGGATWDEMTVWAFIGDGSVDDIKFSNKYVGIMLQNQADGFAVLYATFDGGYTWHSIESPTNDGLNSVHLCDETLSYSVGNVIGGSAMILKSATVVI